MCLGELVEVISVDDGGTADVLRNGRHSSVSLVVLDEPVAVGDWLVVHSGFALERVTAAEAHEVLRIRATRAEELPADRWPEPPWQRIGMGDGAEP